jgi:hypothetical protein
MWAFFELQGVTTQNPVLFKLIVTQLVKKSLALYGKTESSLLFDRHSPEQD